MWCVVIPAVVAGLFVAGWLLFWITRPPEDRGFLGFRGVFSTLIERRLGGYRQCVNHVDPELPDCSDEGARVLVIGAGIAGISAASLLAERGFSVRMVDRHPYLGGKIGAWDHTFDDGEVRSVEHGYHAFFRHYWNFNDFLDRLGLRDTFRSIPDYLILKKDGTKMGFEGIETTPVLNLISLARHGVYKWSEILLTPAVHKMDVFLAYHPEKTKRILDDLSFEEFAQQAHLPASLRLSFDTFSRAFFAEEDRMSMAELVKSFHFYYLSHDGGLVYDYPTDDYQASLLGPIARHLEEVGVEVRLGVGVDALTREGESWVVDGERYDEVVCAAHVVGAAALVAGSPDIQALCPDLEQRLQRLQPTQRYAVLRLWIQGDVRDDLPPYCITDRVVLLDAIALYHRIEERSRAEFEASGQAVIEIHSYAVPDHVPDDAAIRDQLIAELKHFLPETADLDIVREVLQVNQDMCAFPPGVWDLRPGTVSGVPNLWFAGDWVRLPFPAMLMEAAYSSGVVAANGILTARGLREAPVYSVPLEGLLPLPPNKYPAAEAI